MTNIRPLDHLSVGARSVFARCLIVLALSTGAVTATLGAMAFISARQLAVTGVIGEAHLVTEMMAGQAGGAIRFGQTGGLVTMFEAIRADSDGLASAGLALSAAGDVVAQNGDDSLRPELAALARRAVATGATVTAQDGLLQAAPVRFGEENATVGAVATAWTAEPRLAELNDQRRLGDFLTLVTFVVALAAAGWYMRRTVSRPLESVNDAMRQIADGALATQVPQTQRRDEIGQIAKTLESFRASLKEVEETQRQSAFKSAAFEDSSSALMMTDTDFNIVFMNPAMQALFADRADEIRRTVPEFDPHNLIGVNMDVFHANVAHPRRMLQDISKLPIRVTLKFGDAQLSVSIAAVRDADGTPIGFTQEWSDRTTEIRNAAILSSIDATQAHLDIAPDLTIRTANATFAELAGARAEAIRGRHVAAAVTPVGVGDPDAFWSELKATGTASGKFRIMRADGDRIVDGGIFSVADQKGRMESFLLMAKDVTEVEAALAAGEAERSRAAEAQATVVEALRGALERLSDGDMTIAIDQPFPPEYDRLRTDFNRAASKLLEAMRNVVEHAGSINGETNEIRAAADDLSRRTESQAATLEETAAALDQLTASVKSAADGAARAAEMAESARVNAEASGTVVGEAVEAMGAIEKSSQQISKIIGVIDDIAFQTNLLALNAGVEAARAGEAGRGFAVVASEVRALAQRSSEAAREINDLISSSGSHVARGVERVGQTGDALRSIVENVGHIAGHVSEIASSSAEQSRGLAEINTAVNQLDEVTQQNVAMFEETNAASQAMTRSAEALAATVHRFRIGASEGAKPQPIRRRLVAAATDGNAALAEPAHDSSWTDF